MIAPNIEVESGFFGEKTCIISKSGFGKSYTARVIIEEAIQKGHSIIVFDPQDAYLNIPEFDYISAQNVKSVKGLAVLLSMTSKRVVIRLKKLGTLEQCKFVGVFLAEYRKHIRKGIQTIIIDEAHKFAPETEKNFSKEVVRAMFQENRSDGLGCIAVTQRISRLDKTVISQADHLAIGRVTSFRDKEAVKNYIDNPQDLEKIVRLNRGEFYFYGFGLDEPVVAQVRKSQTEHSGNSPKNLLNEDATTYGRYVNKFVKKKGEENMDEVTTSNEVVSKVIPSMDGFLDLAKLGAKVSIGGAVGGMVGTLVGSKFKSPIPVVSSRTLAAGATMVTLYAGYRFMPSSWEMSKDILKYSSAGAAIFTAGSLTVDVLNAAGVQLPNWLGYMLLTATGATPSVAGGAGKSESGSSVDTNTEFA